MPITTFAELSTSVGNWLNRSDLTAVVPDFIALAETEFNRKLRTRDMVARVMTSVTGQYSELPSDYREMTFVKLIVNGRDAELVFLEQGSMVTAHAETSGTAGQPKNYGLTGNSIELCPIPDGAYVMEMGYYAQVPALSEANTSNWLLTKHPDLYLYGSLVQSAPYLKDDERIPVWRDFHASILESIRLDEERASYSGGPLVRKGRAIG